MSEIVSRAEHIVNQADTLQQINNALNAAGIGTWSIQFGDSWHVIADQRFGALFGVATSMNIPYATLLSYIHSDEHAALKAAVTKALDKKNDGIFTVDFRITDATNDILRVVRLNGRAYFDASGTPASLTGICMDITAEIELKAQVHQIKNNKVFEHAINISPSGFWLSDAEGQLIFVNQKLADLRGVSTQSLLGTGWANSIIDEDKETSVQAFIEAFSQRAHYQAEFRIHAAGGSIKWCRAAGDPFYHEDGTFAGYSGFCMDIDDTVKVLDDIQKSESNIRSIIEQAPVAFGVLRGKNLIIEFANTIILNLWGKDTSIIELPLTEALPELEGQPFIEILNNVYRTGEPYYGQETNAKLLHKEKLIDFYFDFVYAPLKNVLGEITGILVVASDVTKQVTAKKMLEESEARFRSLIEEAPIPTCVFIGKELVIAIANEPILNIWGKGNAIVGMPLAAALPELEGQPFLKILEDIFTTKKAYVAKDARADLVVNGVLQTFYFNYTFKPLFDTHGNVYGIMDMAVDVTEDVLHANEIAQAQARLKMAVNTANLGTWEIDLFTGTYKYSYRIMDWFGIDTAEEMTTENVLACVHDKDSLITAIQQAKNKSGNGLIDVEYTVTNKKNKQTYILHTVGQTFLNEKQEPYLLTGSTRDITLQKTTEYELEKQVTLRTEQLQSINEKLAESNHNLFRSNQELSQYAYIASHDLQEPLRKIQMFSNILTKQFEDATQEENLFITKISQSAERMRRLIKDLLDFSRLQGAEKMTRPINLSDVIHEVINDFELTISEKEAQIYVEIDTVPMHVVALQMNQLFYNLLSNALKFTNPGIAPQITIRSKKITAEEAGKYISTIHKDRIYYDIIIADNGIGFEVKYTDQIFEVFKRLHTRDIYPGSGIGLALCRRIVSNHGGHLYAESEPGKGTAFHLILPDQH